MNAQNETATAADKAHQALVDELKSLKDRGLKFSDCVLAFGVKKDSSPLALAAEASHAEDGEIEIDDITVISADGSKNPLSGYVLAWVWAEIDDVATMSTWDEKTGGITTREVTVQHRFDWTLSDRSVEMSVITFNDEHEANGMTLANLKTGTVIKRLKANDAGEAADEALRYLAQASRSEILKAVLADNTP